MCISLADLTAVMLTFIRPPHQNMLWHAYSWVLLFTHFWEIDFLQWINRAVISRYYELKLGFVNHDETVTVTQSLKAEKRQQNQIINIHFRFLISVSYWV